MKSLHIFKIIICAIAICILIVGCNEPMTPAPVPLTFTTTPVPPTVTPVPTDTPVLPAATEPLPTPTPNTIIELFDFEDQEEAIPSGFVASEGASISGEQEVWNKIELDNSVAHSGTTSLKISSDIETNRWNSIARQIPTSMKQIFVSYYVKGNNVRKEGDQWDNCYIGFMFTASDGSKNFKVNSYNNVGTYDWTYGELLLSEDELQSLRDNGSKSELLIFCSVSGEFWVDDLQVEQSPLEP